MISHVDLVARGLERLGVPFEVLGFTTAEWKGGRAAQDWKAAGLPLELGRLGDLLHVVFKTRDAAWDGEGAGAPTPAEVFDRVYRPGNLRENIDGEALRWALSRLPGGEEAEMLFVSDGRPCDDATNTANTIFLLEDDLERALGEAADRGVRVTRVDTRQFPSSEIPEDAIWTGAFRDPVEGARAALERLLAPRPAPGMVP